MIQVLRSRARAGFLAAACLLALGACSCETLSGSGASGAELARSKTELTESRARLRRAAQDGDVQGASRAMTEIGRQFDAVEAKSSSMNLMDREALKIQIATGRRTITEAQRWVPVNDAEAIRSQTALLNPVLDQIDVLLDRAVKSSATPAETP